MSDNPKFTVTDMAAEAMLYGSAFGITKTDGSFERIEPHGLSKEHLDHIEKHGWGYFAARVVSIETARKLFPRP